MDFGELQHLQVLLQRLDLLIRQAVTQMRTSTDHTSEFPSNLVISDAEIDNILDSSPLAGMEDLNNQSSVPQNNLNEIEHIKLKQLVKTFELSSADVDIILFTLAPQLDRSYERIYAYLQDDLTKQWPTVDLAMKILGGDLVGRFKIWERLQAHMPLRSSELLNCAADPNHQNVTFINYSLQLDHRIVMHLLDENQIDVRLRGVVQWYSVSERQFLDDIIPEYALPVSSETSIYYLIGNDQLKHRQIARATCASINFGLIEFDLAEIPHHDLPALIALELAIRECKLLQAGLLLTHWESCLNSEGIPSADLWTILSANKQHIFISGVTIWEPQDETRVQRFLRVDTRQVSYEPYTQIWMNALAFFENDLEIDDIEEIARKYHLNSKKVICAVKTAADYAALRGEPIKLQDVIQGAQAQSQLRLGGFAQKVISCFTWDDLILPLDSKAQLRELSTRMHNRQKVLNEWGFGNHIVRTSGISALFAGQSGTGKTMSAQILASELGLNLYRIDLSAVVSKYIGETEKNLRTIFSEAESSNSVLLFDEADALFGKRSEVRDAHDRYANIETAFLLQQMDDYEGIVILTTNLRQNLDDAFTRRLDFVIEFPFPDEDYRQSIWRSHFPEQTPLDSSVNFQDLAKRYRLAGGNIRNVAVASAYLAAADGEVVSMQHIKRAVKREHQKMGRLLDET